MQVWIKNVQNQLKWDQNYTPKSNNNVETTTELNLTFVDDKELSENKQ